MKKEFISKMLDLGKSYHDASDDHIAQGAVINQAFELYDAFHEKPSADGWKEGDLAYYNFQLVEVDKIKRGKVEEVTTGYIRTAGGDMAHLLIPVSLFTAQMSQRAQDWKDKIREDQGTLNLNWPRISDKISSIWWEMCQCEDDPEGSNKAQAELDDFCQCVIDAIQTAKAWEVQGIKLFRQ